MARHTRCGRLLALALQHRGSPASARDVVAIHQGGAAFEALPSLRQYSVQTRLFSEREGALPHAGAAWVLGIAAASAGAAHTAHAESDAPDLGGVGMVPLDPYAPPALLKGVPQEVILYQYEVCPFCCKVKAFLDYHKIPYRTVEVNPLSKKELKWSKYRKVPMALIDGEPVPDSTAIITRLAAELAQADIAATSKPAAVQKKGWFGLAASGSTTGHDRTGDASCSKDEEYKWRRWVDERYVRLLTVNIYRTAREAFETFDYIADSGKFSMLEREAARIVGAVTMWGLSSRLKKKYAIEGDPREELYAAADQWVGAVGDRKFLGGEKPNLADLSVFGATRSITCTKTFNDLMHNSQIAAWYARMMAAVGSSSRLPDLASV